MCAFSLGMRSAKKVYRYTALYILVWLFLNINYKMNIMPRYACYVT